MATASKTPRADDLWNLPLKRFKSISDVSDFSQCLDDDGLWDDDVEALKAIDATISPNLLRAGAGWAMVSPNLKRYAQARHDDEVVTQAASFSRRVTFEDEAIARDTNVASSSARPFHSTSLQEEPQDDLWAEVSSAKTSYMSPNLHTELSPTNGADAVAPASLQEAITQDDDLGYRGLESLMSMPLLPSVGIEQMPIHTLIQHVLRFQSCPFKCLGIQTGLGVETARKRYRLLARRLHPDKCEHANAGRAFRAIQDALAQCEAL